MQNPSCRRWTCTRKAPTTAQAIALANGAVTGFANFVDQLDGNNVPAGKRIDVRQLGERPAASSIRVRARRSRSSSSVGVLALWCGVVLFVSRLLAHMRAAKQNDAVSQR